MVSDPQGRHLSILLQEREGDHIYVDDIIFARSSSEATTALLIFLKNEFAIKDLGELHYFIGIEFKRLDEGILLTQEKYAKDILRRVGMTDCKPSSTPISTTEKWSLHEGELLSPKEGTKYRSTVGAL